MAVDANILIFERTKEELSEGNSYIAAITTGFERAWSSIRDSNVSSLITCVILWFFGNSIIRGFALMLGLGIIVSMFTAITITRAFLRTLNGTSASKSRFLLGAKKL
jgi:preprotein translocase subunit SecD